MVCDNPVPFTILGSLFLHSYSSVNYPDYALEHNRSLVHTHAHELTYTVFLIPTFYHFVFTSIRFFDNDRYNLMIVLNTICTTS